MPTSALPISQKRHKYAQKLLLVQSQIQARAPFSETLNEDPVLIGVFFRADRDVTI